MGNVFTLLMYCILFFSGAHNLLAVGNILDEMSSDSIEIVKDRNFGTTEKVVIGKFSSFAVDEQNRVYIADQDQTTIFAFDSEGNFLKNIGRQGKGPAEFSAISPVTEIKIRQNLLFVPDYPDPGAFFPNRMQIFSIEDFSFVKTVQLIPHNRKKYEKTLSGYYPQVIYPIDHNSFIVDYRRGSHNYKDSPSYIQYFILDHSSNIVDGPILRMPDVKNLGKVVTEGEWKILNLRTFPFFEKSIFTTFNDGKLITARSGDYHLKIRRLDGSEIHSIELPYEKIKLSRENLLKNYKAGGNKVHFEMIKEADELPDYWPAVNDIVIDDENRIWVSLFTESEKIFKWQVLDENGKKLAGFTWPADKEIKLVRNQYLYTLETDSDGYSIVVRYLIDGLES